MKTHFIAWWNVENLFDLEDSPARSDKLNRTLQSELRGWNESILSRKIANLAAIIRALNDGRGPDLLGVCEVENRPVLQRLVDALAPLGRNYLVAHHDTSDSRGIDVAFIYDSSKFLAELTFSHTIQKRTATRELFQVNFRTASNRLLVVVGNHWPSKLGGSRESEAYRIIAGETLAYFNQRIEDVLGDDTPILAMGDFNDEPCDRSLTDHALSERNRTRVLYANTPKLLNLMWPLMGHGLGTHYYDNNPGMLDQFLVSGGMLKSKSKIKPVEESARIVQPESMTSTGRYATPVRFGRPNSGLNLNGASDHFPISMTLTES
ncbi:MAG TPA: endonuclease/exonuclease/phosphatase [Verrucomicrobiales bacterium]|nr:endonuclease/exonuclease/phosphatase [Verrucomicrobiales bacterium]